MHLTEYGDDSGGGEFLLEDVGLLPDEMIGVDYKGGHFVWIDVQHRSQDTSCHQCLARSRWQTEQTVLLKAKIQHLRLQDVISHK